MNEQRQICVVDHQTDKSPRFTAEIIGVTWIKDASSREELRYDDPEALNQRLRVIEAIDNVSPSTFTILGAFHPCDHCHWFASSKVIVWPERDRFIVQQSCAEHERHFTPQHNPFIVVPLVDINVNSNYYGARFSLFRGNSSRPTGFELLRGILGESFIFPADFPRQ